MTDIQEEWAVIESHPAYQISNTGYIMRDETGEILAHSFTAQGAPKISLMNEERNHRDTVSLKVLVARAFVSGQDGIFNTPICLDGDQRNVHASNLVWRPRWFAIRYTLQFKPENTEHYDGLYTLWKVRDLGTGEMYKNVKDAGVAHGLLWRDVYLSIVHENYPCFPTHQRFEYVR